MKYNHQERIKHIDFMQSILYTIEQKNLPMFLKGGTALLICYKLDRFSDDIDLDSTKKINLELTIKQSALDKNIKINSIKLKKNTDTTKRYIVNYNNDKNLKIEISFRNNINLDDLTKINNIKVYKLDKLITMKLDMICNYGTYINGINQGRRKARDLHDIIYLANTSLDKFEDSDKIRIKNLADNKDIQLEYLLDYSDNSILSDSFFHDLAILEKIFKQEEINLEKIFPIDKK